MDRFGDSVSLFGGWAIVVSASYKNVNGRAYLYKRFLGAWDDRQIIQASDGIKGDYFGGSVSINEKIMVVRSPLRDNGNAPFSGAVYIFTLPGITWTDMNVR